MNYLDTIKNYEYTNIYSLHKTNNMKNIIIFVITAIVYVISLIIIANLASNTLEWDKAQELQQAQYKSSRLVLYDVI